mgnify:CR=1 FL=1
MKPGDLIRDTYDGSIGLVTSEVRSYTLEEQARRVYHKNAKYVMVLWPSNEGEPVKMDMQALDHAWVEKINDAR